MNEKTLKLTPKEITTILTALDERPHKEVAALIRKIVVQVAENKTREQSE